MTSTDDAEAFAHYDDPANREPAAGEARHRRARTLARHVAVRCPAETVESIRPLAQSDGVTVGAWIRRAVSTTIRQRERR